MLKPIPNCYYLLVFENFLSTFRIIAAYGCLKPIPTNRLRRAYLHLRDSIVFAEHVLGTIPRLILN